MKKLLLLMLLAGCESPPRETLHDLDVDAGAHCKRCGTRWSEADLQQHEWHRRELTLMMYASGCEFCRYHGAYKDM